MQNRGFSIFRAFILFVASMVIGCSSDSSPAVPSFSADTVQNLQQIVDSKRSSFGLPGVVVGVWIPGQGEWVYASGVSNSTTGQQLTTADKMRIASVTKTYTATVVLQLIMEGKLTLDTTLDRFAPYVPLANQITIRYLLNHTSGIATYSAETFTEILRKNPKTVWTPRQLVDLGISQPAKNAPGEKHSYSNTNYILLGMIIEQITGNKAEDEVQRRVLGPLLMGASLFPSVGMTSIPAPYSHGYWPQENGDGLSDITEIDPSSHWTSGAIISNVYDLRIWGEALAKGSLLSPAMQDQRLIWVNNPNDSNKFYGLGIMKYGEFLGHDGTMPGFESLVYHLPSRNATIVVLANTLSPPNPPPQEEIFKAIVELLIPEAAIWKK